jgi:hypothetical protein
MAARTFGAFAAGVAVGWVGRSVLGSGRELVVRSVVVGHRVRERMTRTFAEQAEWLEDMFAEGRSRYESTRAHEPVDEEAHARVSKTRSAA